MNIANSQTAYVIKDTSDEQYYNSKSGDIQYRWKETINDATVYKTDKRPTEILQDWGYKGYELYPAWLKEATDKGKTADAERYQSNANFFQALFNNCVVEEHEVQTRCVNSFGMKATSTTTVVTDWSYEKVE